MAQTAERTQQGWARVAGIALMAIIVLGLAGTVLQGQGGGAGSELRRIGAHQTLYRTGLACEFGMLSSDILLAGALYGLLRRVDATLALLGAFWRCANALILGVGVLAALTALGILDAPGHAPDIAAALLQMHGGASLVGLLFWSFGAAIHSHLLWTSRYIPRLLSGAYLAVAVAILLGCLLVMVSPAAGAVISPWFVLPDLPVELAVSLWLMIRGAGGAPR